MKIAVVIIVVRAVTTPQKFNKNSRGADTGHTQNPIIKIN